MAIRTWSAAAALSMLAAVGCSTKVGDGQAASAGSTLTAVITPIGHQAVTSGCSASVCITVRAGENVLLSGKDTVNEGAAIADFQWTVPAGALPDPPDSGALIYHSRNTVSFRAPRVAAGTAPLDFKFTVTNTIGQTSSATARVTIQPANDSNQFLSPLLTRHHFIVAVAPTADVPSVTGQTSIPVCVTVQRQLTYTQAGSTTAQTIALTALKADGSWSAAKGGVASDFTAYQNPKVTFEIPALNQDDILSQTNRPGAPISLQPNAATVDSDQLQLVASAAPGSCDGSSSASLPANVSLLVQVQDSSRNPVPAGSTGAASVTFTPDMLASAEGNVVYETADTARAYYDAIDPTGSNTTLSQWLANNCFDEKKPNYGAAAHATYTNNYDLGFGRDMYSTSCADNTTPGRAKGDFASVVINYPSLEAAVLKQQTIIAVAMEYNSTTAGGAPANGSRHFTKFFVFAPDSTDGTFKRVLSANFDGRGEKYVPGACVMCHGGTLPTMPQPNFVHKCSQPQSCAADQPYVAVANPDKSGATLALGDVAAGFMPWDVDSLLFSNNDPSYTGANVGKAGYQQTDQESAIKKLNQLAYCTMQPEMQPVIPPAGGAAVPVDRYATARQLISRWYGGDLSGPPDADCAASGTPTESLLPKAAYDDKSTTPALWTAQSATGGAGSTSTSSDNLYHQVFARYCRSCHVMNATVPDQFADYQTFVSTFQPQSLPQGGHPPGLGLQYVYQQGRMPLARLTDDRFWVGDAATLLAKHISEVNGSADSASQALLDSAGNAVGPGKPVISIDLKRGNPNGSPNGRFAGATANAFSDSPSFFVDHVNWSLALNGADASANLISSQSGAPAFTTDSLGTYELTLNANGAPGISGSGQTSWAVTPTFPSYSVNQCPSAVNLEVSQSTTINLAPANIGTSATGCIGLGDGLNAVQYRDASSMGPWTPLLPLSASSVPGSFTGDNGAWRVDYAGAPVGSPNSIDGYSLTFTYVATPSAAAAIDFRVSNVDQQCENGGSIITTCGSRRVTFHFTRTLDDKTLIVPTPAAFNSSGDYVSSFLSGFSYSTSAQVFHDQIFQGIPDSQILSFNLSNLTASVTATSSAGGVPASLTYTYPGSNPIRCDVSGLISYFSGSSNCGSENFKYTMTGDGFTVTGANNLPATVTIQTRATTSFHADNTTNNQAPANGVPIETGGSYGMLTSGTTNCAGCHGSTSSNMTWSNLARSKWIYYAVDPQANPAVTPLNTYGSATSNFRKWATTKADGVTTTSDPTQSAIYEHACKHLGSPHSTDTAAQLGAATDSTCKYLVQWIAEGANYD